MFKRKSNEDVDSVIRRYRDLWRTEGNRGLTHPAVQTNDDEMCFTGERLVVNEHVKSVHAPVFAEHVLRYDWACRLAAGKKVLDAACGTGFGSKMLEQAGASEVWAVDISAETIRHAQAAYPGTNIHYMQSDVRKLPFSEASFDMIVSFETIEHIPEGGDWIRESARLLPPGGLFLVSTPNRRVTNPGLYYEERPVNPYHGYEYTPAEFVGELLPHYDVLELYGQTLRRDHENPGHIFLRQVSMRDAVWAPALSPETSGHELVPFAEIKNAEPTLVLAVCRKKGG